MVKESIKNEIFWKNPGYKVRKPLTNDISCDYLIVGGGVLGVSLGYFLLKNGAKNVVLIEKGIVASGATGRAAGMITISGELDLKDVVENHGKLRGTIFWRESHEGLRLMKDIVKKENIKCDAEPQDTIYGGLDNENHKFILEEFAIEDEIEKETQLLSQLISNDEMYQYVKTDLFRYAILSHDHGLSVNPLQYTQNLSVAAEKRGLKVYENTPLIKIKGDVATTSRAKIRFNKAILALDAKIKGVKNRKSTIAITSKLTKQQVKDIGLDVKKFIWTTKRSYEYMKLTKDNRLLIGFGDKTVTKSDNSLRPNPVHFARIKTFLREIFPQIGNLKFEYAWSGNYGVTGNYIPVIDIQDNMISIGGASSQLVCTITAKYLADKLMNIPSSLDQFFWV